MPFSKLFLGRKNFFLFRSPAVVSTDFPITPDDAVTWNFRVIIFVENIPDRTISLGAAGRSSHFFVRQSLPLGNLAHHFQNFLSKRCLGAICRHTLAPSDFGIVSHKKLLQNYKSITNIPTKNIRCFEKYY